MNKFTKTLLCTAVLALGAIQADALNLINPAPGSTTTVSSIGVVKLQWDAWVDEEPQADATLLNAADETIATAKIEINWDEFDQYKMTFSPAITDLGTYTLVIPANLAADNDNPEYRLTFVVEEDNSIPGEPTLITPTPGSSITQSDFDQFNQIRLDFANDDSIEVNAANITLTDASGTAVPFEILGWYSASDPMLSWADNPFVIFSFNEMGNMASGTYTLTCKPGTFTAPRGVYTGTVTATYEYTKTKADAITTPLEITSALMGSCKSLGYNDQLFQYEYEWIATDAKPVTENMEVARLVGTNDEEVGTGFLITINHGEASEYVTYSLIDLNENEALQTSECVKQADGSFLLPWPTTRDLYEGTNYAIEFHAYTDMSQTVENGDGAGARLTLKGTSDPYLFSSAKFVTAVPTPGTALTSLEDNKITVLFSEPVIATAEANLGFGFTEAIECTPVTEGATYDNVWNVFLPANLMSTYPELDVAVAATGRDGLVVSGNSGELESSSNLFSYTIYVRQPRIMLKQTNSHVAEINKFVAYSSKGNAINNGYMDYPYVINEKGERVAEINQEYYTDEWGDKLPYDPILWSEGLEPDILELEFQMIPAITEKGKYTLVFPYCCFSFGTQFESDSSVPQQMDFYVVDFFPVTYTVDSNTVALGEVEFGYPATLAVNPAEGWKLESLLLNDEDVTADVTNGRYVSKPATEAMNFVATYAFDGVVATPSGADEVVTDLELRGWSKDGSIFVSGLKDGQTVNVYTIGGSMMKSVAVNGADTLEFSLAEGVYIVTVTEAGKTVALKLINK